MTRFILHPLPLSAKGFVSEDECGDSVIILNSKLSYEQNLITALHEQGHINHHDLDSIDTGGASKALHIGGEP